MRIRKVIGRAGRSTIFIIIAVTTLGFVTTYSAWKAAVYSSSKNLEESTSQRVMSLEKILDERLVSYEGVLVGGAGLYDANGGKITSEQWRLFAEAHKFNEQFPAIESLGYVEKNIVVYAEPQTDTTAVGRNLQTNSLLADVLKQAAETGQISTSSILDLKNKQGKALFIVYPLYLRQNSSQIALNNNVSEFVYLEININKLFEVVQKNAALQNMEFTVSEGEDAASQQYIYTSPGFDRQGPGIINKVVSINEKKWVIHAEVDKSSISYSAARTEPLVTSVVGVLTTIILAVFLGQTLRSRSRHINYVKERQLNKSRDELLSLASHQLRTPATSVKHYVGMLLQGYGGKIDKRQREFLNRAYSANERQLEIVNQILHVSRIESGRLELTNQTVNMAKLVKQVMAQNKQMVKTRQQKIKLEIDQKLPAVLGDPNYLAIVIENLLTNASKYTAEKGSISVMVYSEATNLILEVSDTGVGIDKKDLDQLFKKFSRIHNELSIRSGGSGIGLYLSKLIVEMHGGSIEAISHKDVGTTFRVKFPLEGNEQI